MEVVEAADSEGDAEGEEVAEEVMTWDRQRELCLLETSHMPARRI